MVLNFKTIILLSIFFSNYNIFSKLKICCCCKDKNEVPDNIKKWYDDEVKKSKENHEKIKDEDDKKEKDEDDKKDDEDLNKYKNKDIDKKNNDDKKDNKDLNKDKEKENKYRIDFSNDDNRFEKEYNKKYNEILIKYLNNKSLDYNKCVFKVENIKSQNHCRKITINDNKVVFIKHDNIDNSFYIDLLKSLDYCDLEYIYQDGVILTEEVKNDYEIELKGNFDRQYFNKSKDILEKTENLLPYFTILSFLNFWDCGTLKLNNHIFKKQNNDKYLIKALDIDVKNEKREGNNNDYYNFYFDLNTGFQMFKEIRLFVTQTFNYKNSDFKKFIIFTNYSINFVETISNIFKDEVEELQVDEIICFRYFETNIFLKEFLKDYLENKLKYTGKYKDRDEFEFLLSHFKDNFDNFLKDYITYIFENNEDMLFFYNSDEILEKVCKYLKIEKKANYNNNEKIDILLNLYQKLKEKTEKTFELLFEYFEFYKYLGDKMKNITEEQKKEIKEKFDKMLDFLINNKDNEKYDKDQFNKVVENIKEVQKSKLFPFIFNDENIKDKITKLT